MIVYFILWLRKNNELVVYINIKQNNNCFEDNDE